MFVSAFDAIIEPSTKPQRNETKELIECQYCKARPTEILNAFFSPSVSISNGIYQSLLLEYCCCWLVLNHSEQSHQTYWAHRFENIHLNLVHSFLINKTLDLCVCAVLSLPLRFASTSNSFLIQTHDRKNTDDLMHTQPIVGGHSFILLSFSFCLLIVRLYVHTYVHVGASVYVEL